MTKKYHVKGLVQGVGFRYFVYQKAIKFGIKGSVRNLPCGDVEIIVSGLYHEKFLEKVRDGNFFSKVDDIVEVEELEKEYNSFKILY